MLSFELNSGCVQTTIHLDMGNCESGIFISHHHRLNKTGPLIMQNEIVSTFRFTDCLPTFHVKNIESWNQFCIFYGF